jgi:hypothetical protein
MEYSLSLLKSIELDMGEIDEDTVNLIQEYDQYYDNLEKYGFQTILDFIEKYTQSRLK